MKVVLLQDVKAQGKKNDVVEVSEGYARNFLFPRKLAIVADAKAINDLKNKESSQQHRVELEKAKAKELSERLENTQIKITLEAGNDGRPYGAVTSKDIALAVSSQLGVEIDKRKIMLDAPIKAFGTYKIDVKLYAEISARLTVSVLEK